MDDVINPFNATSICKLDERIYTSYKKLSGLSRRARYLCHEKPEEAAKKPELIFQTHDKHLSKSIYHLNVILEMAQREYKVDFDIATISCPDLTGKSFSFFKVA
ncbi:hypothetical protein [Ekhidna sp.]|uniref:hypothetical protein n=1 Tax=Ekhidna sp. TaxID=2608089 RepID=UPI0035156D97